MTFDDSLLFDGPGAHGVEGLLVALRGTRGAKTAFKVLRENFVIRATWRGRPHGRSRTAEFVVKLGRPNYLERKFIALCIKAGEPIPVRKIQLRFYPKKKR